MSSGMSGHLSQTTDEIDLAELFGVMRSQLHWIGVAVCFFLIMGIFYAWVTTPTYRANALVQIETSKPPLMGISQMSELIVEDSNAASEIELIRSRMVLGEAVKAVKLQTVAEPKYFPVVGRALSRYFASTDDNQFSQPWVFPSYAWGGEKIKLERLIVPRGLNGKPLLLVKRSNNNYTVHLDGKKILQGVVGQLARSEEGNVEIFVSQLEARVGTKFQVVKHSLNEAIGYLKGRLSINEKGKSTGILSLALSGAVPEENQRTLDAIAKAYLKQNVSRKSEEAQNSLAFLEKQLPRTQAEMSAAENRLNSFRLKNHSVDLTLETQALLEKVVKLEAQLSKIELERSQLLISYTKNHPIFQGLNDEERLIKDKLAELNQGSQALPDTQIQIMRLTRQVQVSTEVYTQLLNRLHELKIAKAGAVGSVRIIDFAYNPPEPVKPKKTVIIVISTLLGGMLGMALVLARHFMNPGIKTPEEIESSIGLSVYASIPLSESLGILKRNAKKRKSKTLLAEHAPKDLAIESLRSLRTNLVFAQMEVSNNRIMISGSAPGVGKSFVSANLAALLAENGKKVLLIDSDMRKGILHETFGLSRGEGLAEALCNDGDNIQLHNVNDKLTFLACGCYPPNPSELLASPVFKNVLERFSDIYDVVIVDTPPILAVTDPALVGNLCGISFMVARANQTSINELRYANERIEKAGVSIKGCILNGMSRTAGAYGGYGYYNYAYES